MKVVTVAEMRRLEAESAKLGIAAAELMENAGRAVTQSMRNILGSVTGKRIVALVGPGNNGGDGLMAARYLADWGASVSIYLAQARPDDDKNFKLVAERDITVLTGAEGMAEMERALYAADAALDAFFGTGQSRAIDGPYKEALDRLAEIRAGCSNLKIFSIDLPSGLNADNGAADPATPRADYTLTLGLPKRGLYQADGAALSGQVVTLDIGIPPRLATDIKTELMDDELMRPLLPPRPPLANKGSFGRALVVAGSANYIGAAYLACAGAARSGAGLVTLAAAQSLVPVVASRLAEAVYIPLPEESPA
jgi:NAD(P)H-hydrate epimerase